MFRTLIVFLLAAAAAFAADVTGAWKGVSETPMGPMDTIANLKSNGGAVIGTLNFTGNDQKIEKGKLDGDKISFEISMDFGTLAYKGTVSGDEIKLTVSLDGNEGGSVVLKRTK